MAKISTLSTGEFNGVTLWQSEIRTRWGQSLRSTEIMAKSPLSLMARTKGPVVSLRGFAMAGGWSTVVTLGTRSGATSRLAESKPRVYRAGPEVLCV